jgi:hypothetical protein
MKIHLHVERLVLDGLPVTSNESAYVQAAVESELERLLTEGGLSHELQRGITVPGVRAGSLQFGEAQHAAGLGHGIARAVHEGIGNSPKRGNPR